MMDNDECINIVNVENHNAFQALPRDYLVYMLVSTVKPQQTYVGVTNNFRRRIRQHNGDLKHGGARRTRAYRPWRAFLHVTGLTKTQALQLEWAIKHRRRGGVAGPDGRVRTLEFLMTQTRWTAKAPLIDDIAPIKILCSWSSAEYEKRSKCTTTSWTKSCTRHFNQILDGNSTEIEKMKNST